MSWRLSLAMSGMFIACMRYEASRLFVSRKDELASPTSGSKCKSGRVVARALAFVAPVSAT